METERLILDSIRESDKEDYFINISHDKKVLETFICRYAETLEDFDFSSYPGRSDLFAVRLKETGRLIGIEAYVIATKKATKNGRASALPLKQYLYQRCFFLDRMSNTTAASSTKPLTTR